MTAAAQLNAALADRYRIEREIGRGGMATVYLARDLKHDRNVALKVLDPELGAVLGVERFLSEIKVTANLQHPNLLPLFDSGSADGLLFYVMPFVEGESLRARLQREKQLPVDEAIRIATAVASALDYAHRHGVIHRDLKPENILLHDGQPVVADFGIALAVSNAGGARVTQTGLSLGTPQYMSPEQATGDRAIDQRTDIYSLGAVTYEMLAGEPPHAGPTAQAIIAKLMTEEPRPLIVLRRSVPPHVDAAIRCALEKLPADRFATANEFAEALARPGTALPRGREPARRETPLHRFAFPTAIGIAIVTTAVAAWLLVERARQPAPRVVRSVIELDSGQTLNGPFTRVALSPDGSRIVYATAGGLRLRDRSRSNATLLRGTEHAQSPAFSPDGERVAFYDGEALKMVSIRGGPPVTITDRLVGAAGLTWARDGTIYGDGSGANPLMEVAASAGAKPRWFTALDTAAGETDHLFPDVLPNGKGVLFSTLQDERGRVIALADTKTGRHRVILSGTVARYSPSGHILFTTANGSLMAVAFDQDKMEIRGEPFAVAEGLRTGMGGASDYGVSSNGSLLFVAGDDAAKRELIWMDRSGRTQQVDTNWRQPVVNPSLSPDGRQLAVMLFEKGQLDIWVKKLDAGPALKLTFETGYTPTWTPDGKSVTYAAPAVGGTAFLTKRADGSGQPQKTAFVQPSSLDPQWSPDGKWIVYTAPTAGNFASIYGVRPGIDHVPVPLVHSPFASGKPSLSPSGRWLAYVSNESGQFQVYVVPFPNTAAAKWAVSTRGGETPLWSHSGRELFYKDEADNLVSVEVDTGQVFSVRQSTVLFRLPDLQQGWWQREFDVSPDGKRFIFIRPSGGASSEKMIVVDNWFEELKTLGAKAR